VASNLKTEVLRNTEDNSCPLCEAVLQVKTGRALF